MDPMTGIEHYRTLLLDSSFRPVKVIPWSRAVTLDFQNKVIIVETYDRFIGHPSYEMRVPAVVALKQYLRYHPFKVRFTKRNVFLRDGYACQYCNERFPSVELTIDHVVPRAQGGRSSWENVVTACEPCNHRKSDRTPKQAGMPLLSKPERPRPSLHGHVVARTVPDQWTPYLGQQVTA